MLKARQQLKLLQKISPQQIQFIKLLQIPTATLDMRIKEEIEINPALEDGRMEEDYSRMNDEYGGQDNGGDDDYGNDSMGGDDDFHIEDYISEGDDIRTRDLPRGHDDDDDYEVPVIQMKSFYDQLMEQLGLITLEPKDEEIAKHLIGSLDEDGYLRRPVPAIVNDLAFRHNLRTTAEEIEKVLRQIQKFDPAGIGARDLQECLILQLERKEQTAEVGIAITLLRDFFEEFTKKHFARLKSQLGVSEDTLKDVYNIITKLNPKPGESQSVVKHEYIIPDFQLIVKDGEIDIKLNGRNAPDLKVSRSYIKMYEEYKEAQKKRKDSSTKETLDFVKQKIEAAQWFIDALKQRQFTLLNTMYAIAEKQQEFFVSGGDEKKLRPMILKDIADEIQMDISTVSRVANSKYVDTEWGIYPLKYFFTEGIATESGEEVSNREVKTILSELIGNEDKRKPLSDDKLSEILHEKGYPIARRTVAKYREQLNLPVARLRKEM